jgi:hypothetical protein
MPQNVSPTPTFLPDRLEALPDRSRDLRYLQFWTISVRFAIELETTAVLRFTSLEAENTGNGLRRFILRDSNANDNGWVLLDETWIELVIGQKVGSQEFILLSEAIQEEESSDADATQVEHGPREYNAMMIVWRDGIAERAGLGRVVTCAQSTKAMEWKEILLG